MDFTEQLLFTLPIYLGPLLVLSLTDFYRKSGRYQFNEMITNATIALGNLGFSFVILLAVVFLYNHIYDNYAFFQWNPESPFIYLLAFLLYDFCYYWNHRFHHMIGIFWADHLVHHSAENMNFGVSIRLSYFMELTMWMTFSLLAFAGIPMEIFLVVSYIQLTYAFFLHTKSLKHTPILDKFINTPSLHRVHHARNDNYMDKNFGGILVIWDQLFGTYQRESQTEPPVYGIAESFRSFSPVVLNVQYLQVIGRKIKASRSFMERIKSVIFSPGWLPQKADADDVFREIPIDEFTPQNPAISLITKVATALRFILLLIVFTGLMASYGDLTIGQNISLSLLFFWLCHINGITFDGKPRKSTDELVTQILIAGFALFSISGASPAPFLLPDLMAAGAFSLLSLICFSMTRHQQSPQDHPVQGTA